MPPTLLLMGLALLVNTSLAQAQSEAYRRGYEQGYADGLAAARQAPWQGEPNPAWSGPFTPAAGAINLYEARYGTADRACDARAGIARALANQPIPVLMVNNGLCGDPAPNQRKFLTVRYSCPGQGPMRQQAWEGQPLDLSCR